ncbi:glutaredoxin family protein [Meiothermus granaticius]|uniref:Putative glutaredoxin.1 n=1 Tax=Meiothermus granaticius NBRC 107808 TaxID=1227551 RepID=A0A399FDJ4_9DEIN|nr:glutaredoxin family protein [Meiothermus granaticius]MCL6526393.1 glutaredoxin family protein [Thermaceae bacterium]RIH93509.1 putative glutaredoxin.1 [Meiothermus granaticius NBRC 107808]GEM86005.1 NrdH-redoxin [Meiothermus granaticius NBRC 107808]
MLTIFSTSWCGDCKALKQALTHLNLPFQEIDIDQQPQAEQRVLTLNGGRRSVPTLVYGDKATSLSQFSIVKLKRWLGEVGLQARV